jgi:hypothetical protein
MHRRVRNLRGSASGYDCIGCGQPAAEWSYEGNDPAEVRDPRTPGYGPYSTDPQFYLPRCISCHRLHDVARARRRIL